MKKINVLGTEISYYQHNEDDFICLTDMIKNIENGLVLIEKWLRNKNTIEFLGVWEEIYNPHFNSPEFEGIKNQAGLNRFTLSVKQWSEKTNSVGIVAKAGRYGGTYAHKDIAFEFASWISPQFKLYLIKEFQRLKESEKKQLGWDIRRNLAKINYRIHTDAIKENLVPKEITKEQTNQIYASEADVLNAALFGMTAKEWQDSNKNKTGNIRDYANVSQLVCLSNLENLNALLINDGFAQDKRLTKLNKTAIQQMKLLTEDKIIKKLELKTKKMRMIELKRSALILIIASILILFTQSASALNTFYTTQSQNITLETSGYSQVNDTRLVGRWSCEGNFNDSSGLNNHGTQSGGVKIDRGVKGRACGFDGAQNG